MAREWIVEAKSEGAGAPVLTLGIKDARSGKIVPLIEGRRSLQDFEKELSLLKGELDRTLEAACGKMEALGAKGKESQGLDPQMAWRKMESFGSEEQMFEYFNGLSQDERHRVAEYVFSNVSMFKGKGPVFSQHYDASSCILE